LVSSPFDGLAPSFDRHRALPDGVPATIRTAILAALGGDARPRVLDLGAGSGRVGWPFVAAGDDYVGVDLSAGMLRVFAGRNASGERPNLVQADGGALPFADGSFDAVLLIAVFGDLPNWRRLADETRRVLARPRGAVILGRTATPDDGIDERLKQRLDMLLDECMPGKVRRRANGPDVASQYFAARAAAVTELTAANWSVERTPRAFLERHADGARFSRLPRAEREAALRGLAVWAETEFGSLDARFAETHRFEMRMLRFTESL
jgi:SAM-dependent methyltransferase